MIKTDVDIRHYKTVSAYSIDNSDLTLHSGDHIHVSQYGGSAIYDSNVKVEIIKDPTGTPEVLFCTHGDSVQDVPNALVEGPITIRISLNNQSSSAETIGAYYTGELCDE